MLCFLFAKPFRLNSLPIGQKKKWLLRIVLGGIAYGTIMEFVQKYWIPNRSFELADIAADSVGCALCYWYGMRKLNPSRPPLGGEEN